MLLMSGSLGALPGMVVPARHLLVEGNGLVVEGVIVIDGPFMAASVRRIGVFVGGGG